MPADGLDHPRVTRLEIEEAALQGYRRATSPAGGTFARIGPICESEADSRHRNGMPTGRAIRRVQELRATRSTRH